MLQKRGRNGIKVGEGHHNSKLTEPQVKEVRRMVSEGVCLKCTRIILGITCSNSTLWDAANYTTWRHVRD
jgi:hypothetical protein